MKIYKDSNISKLKKNQSIIRIDLNRLIKFIKVEQIFMKNKFKLMKFDAEQSDSYDSTFKPVSNDFVLSRMRHRVFDIPFAHLVETLQIAAFQNKLMISFDETSMTFVQGEKEKAYDIIFKSTILN